MKPIAAMPALTTKMRSSAPRFCSVAGRAAHELPGVVDPAREAQRDHQRGEHAGERGEDAER